MVPQTNLGTNNIFIFNTDYFIYVTPADQISDKSGFEIWRESDSNPSIVYNSDLGIFLRNAFFGFFSTSVFLS